MLGLLLSDRLPWDVTAAVIGLSFHTEHSSLRRTNAAKEEVLRALYWWCLESSVPAVSEGITPEGRWPTGDNDVCHNTVTACVRNLLLRLAAVKYNNHKNLQLRLAAVKYNNHMNMLRCKMWRN